MTQYDNTNRGAIFKNDRKEKDTHPDYKGSLNVEGAEYWVSSWIKEGPKGKFMSLSLTPKDQAYNNAAPPPDPQQRQPAQRPPAPIPRQPGPAQRSSGFDDIDCDIPF